MRQRRKASLPGFLQRRAEHCLMTAMNAVEIADRNHAAAQAPGQIGKLRDALERVMRHRHRYLRCGMTATGA